MKVLIVLLCAIVGAAFADECNALQRLKVKEQWIQVYGDNSHLRTDFGIAVWRSIFVQAPESRALFDRVNGQDINSGEFIAHAGRVLEGFGMIVGLLDQEDILQSSLAHLKQQHIDRNIPPKYFDAFKKAIMKIIPASLGKCFDEVAWSQCFDVIKQGISE